MILLVDGSNVLGSARLTETARRELLQAVASHARSRRARALLVFDGNPSESFARGIGHVQVKFSGAGSADDIIAAAAASAREPVVVITRDAGLRARVRRRQVSCEGPERLLQEETESSTAGTDGDWESWFNDPSNRL